MSTLNKKQEWWLKVAHGVAGMGHLGSAVAIAVATGGKGWRPALEITHESWIEYECVKNSSFGNLDKCFEQSRITETFSVSLVWICFSFAMWSALWHGVTILRWKKEYLSDLQRGVSRFRWYDYVVSSSLMIAVIAIFSGVVDIWSISGISILQAIVIILGKVSEKSILRNDQIMWFWLSSIIYLAGVWLPLIVTFAKSVATIPESQGSVPTALGVGFAMFFAVFSSFAVVAWVNIYKRFKTFITCEVAYIILSLVSKTLLHWVLFYSLLNRAETLGNAEFDIGDTTLNVSTNSVYMVIGATVGGGIFFAIFLYFMWKRSRGAPTLTVDRDLLKSELIENTRIAYKAFHVN